MEIVKIPKKFRDILDLLRNGKIENGIELLGKIKGFEPQKAIVLAEINYFSTEFENAMKNDEIALPNDQQWYAGNILYEHFFAYSNTAIESNNVLRAETFYKKYLEEKEKLNLQKHLIDTYRHQVSQHLEKLKGIKNLIIDIEPLQVIKNGESHSTFVEQLKEYRPKLTYESAKGAEYLLNFMFEEGNTEESLAYYEKYAENLNNENTHINASRLFLATNQIEKAKTAILNYSVNCWYPVEYIQITPMRLFEFEDLKPILTKEFKKEILYKPKAKK
jgi:hypothetical protein